MSEPGVPPATGHGRSESLGGALLGSRSALGELLDIYRGYLMKVAEEKLDHRLRARMGPSDLVQETFLQAAKDFPQFKGTTAAELRAWLVKILVHNVQDSHRRHCQTNRRAVVREAASLTPAAGFPSELLPGDETASALMIVAEEREILIEAIARLPEESRRVVELRSIERKPFDEVARELGRTVDAARKLWSRAIQQLARELSHHVGQ